MIPIPRRIVMMLPQRLRTSFALRVAALFLGLLALLQLASVAVVRGGLGTQARNALPERLAAGERVLETLIAQRRQASLEAARLIVADDGFQSAVRSAHKEAVAAALESQLEPGGATAAGWLSDDFHLLAGAGSGMAGAQLAEAARSLAADPSQPALVLVRGQPHLLALVPLKLQGQPRGWLGLGVPLADELGAELARLSGLQLTLLARERGDAPWAVAQTTLAAGTAARLAAQRWPDGPVAMQSVAAGDEELGVQARWLDALGSSRRAQSPALLALVSLSVDEAARMPQGLQLGLLAITLLGMVVFGIGSLHTAAGVTTPLRQVTQAAERLGAGDPTTPLGAIERSDEIGALARGFERMRVSVAERQQQLLRLAYWDTLTGLPNRAQFGDAVRDAIGAAQGRGTTVAVLVLELERLVNIQARLGHAVGERLLQAAAERLARQVMREGDMVARHAGETFAVLLRESTPELARSVAQRIAQAFEQPLAIDEHRLELPAGVGLACWPEHAADAEALIQRAERAMLAARRSHAGPLAYEPAMDDSSTQSLTLLAELREAPARGELRLHLQPKLSLATGGVAGAEALLRWQHPQRGLLPPADFIPFAEQTGFVRELTLWVFEACARSWRDLQAEGVDMVLSVNLSARDLLDAQLPATLEKRLLDQRVPAEAFCLEVTEGAILEDPQRALATMKRLSLMGFKLAIDDFGSGLTSYAWLKQLPVDELKIDMAFVRGMDRDPVDAKLVRSMIELAHNLGLGVVAEGVENARSWELLRELNCDQAQGFHMGRPMPAHEFLAWSARWVDKRRMLGAAGNAGLLH